MEPRILLVSVHMGPLQSLAPLEKEFLSGHSIFLVDGLSREVRRRDGLPLWDLETIQAGGFDLDRFLLDNDLHGIIRGTSDGLPDRNLEQLAGLAATRCGLPVFVVEDFPGNYQSCDNERLDGLFVEDTTVGEIHRARNVPPGRIHCLGNPRYDSLREVPRVARRQRTRAALGLGDQNVVLWAGQPHGSDSFDTLERLVPSLSRDGVTLLFKAHPRDAVYHSGAYASLLSRLSAWQDVTATRDTIDLCCAADLVVTQFSSVGVEASYLGTPALFVLFDDLGQAYLRTHKGYGLVPLGEQGCAFVLKSRDAAAHVVDAALFDETARRRILDEFARKYGTRPRSAHAIASVVRQYLCDSA